MDMCWVQCKFVVPEVERFVERVRTEVRRLGVSLDAMVRLMGPPT